MNLPQAKLVVLSFLISRLKSFSYGFAPSLQLNSAFQQTPLVPLKAVSPEFDEVCNTTGVTLTRFMHEVENVNPELSELAQLISGIIVFVANNFFFFFVIIVNGGFVTCHGWAGTSCSMNRFIITSIRGSNCNGGNLKGNYLFHVKHKGSRTKVSTWLGRVTFWNCRTSGVWI